MLYLEKPKNFVPDVETVGCFVVWLRKILLLKRTFGSRYGGLWGLPSGHIESGETPAEAMIRELWEETRIETFFLQALGKAYIAFPNKNYIFHLYRYNFFDYEYPVIIVDLAEHSESRFYDLESIKKIKDKIIDTDSCINYYLKD